MVFSLCSRSVALAYTPTPVIQAYLDYGQEFSSSYGLFRTMTGVGPKQICSVPTLTFSIQTQEDSLAFRQFDLLPFYSKLKQVAPHQPRLDWQMWFAALAPDHAVREPWFRRLCDEIFFPSSVVWDTLMLHNVQRNVTKLRVELHQFDYDSSMPLSVSQPAWKSVGPKRKLLELTRQDIKSKGQVSDLLRNWTAYGAYIPLTLCLVVVAHVAFLGQP